MGPPARRRLIGCCTSYRQGPWQFKGPRNSSVWLLWQPAGSGDLMPRDFLAASRSRFQTYVRTRYCPGFAIEHRSSPLTVEAALRLGGSVTEERREDHGARLWFAPPALFLFSKTVTRSGRAYSMSGGGCGRTGEVVAKTGLRRKGARRSWREDVLS